ncbi:MAG: ankyrin repeat domain-containing protein [Bacteroidales bacterium]|nr:ankyrin repeat domain-containing protein [Bacteroidales bacterium]
MKRTIVFLLISMLSCLYLFSQTDTDPKTYKKYLNVVVWGNKTKAQRLIDKGYNLDAKDSDGKTILMYCLKSNNTAFAEYFIDQGANVNEADSFGNTCLHYALENTNNKNIVYRLIDKGANPDAVNHQNYSPFHFSILFACGKLPFYFIEKGVNYKRITALNENALHLSIEAGCDTLTRYLLKQNINLYLQDVKGITPLIQACRFRQAETAIELIKLGADVNSKDLYGNAPLNYTIWNFDTLAFRALLALGADVDNPSFIKAAAEMENQTFIRELLLKGASDSLPGKTHDDLYNLGLVHYVKADIDSTKEAKIKNLQQSMSCFKSARLYYKKRENELMLAYTGEILTQMIEAALTGYVAEDESEVEREYNYMSRQIQKCGNWIKVVTATIENIDLEKAGT